MSNLAALFLALMVTAPAEDPALAVVCPDTTQGETVADCPWAGITRELLRAASEGRDLGPIFQRMAGPLDAQLKSDATHPEILNMWGRSINFDELAKGQIVDPVILRLIAREVGAPWTTDRIAHAGMEHTYGYLFSTLKTSFGYKRARWVKNEIEQAFALPNNILGPNTKSATILANATYLGSMIAFRNEPERLKMLSFPVDPALTKFDFKALKIMRIEEEFPAARDNGVSRTVVLRTDLVKFLNAVPGSTDTNLLVYSINDPAEGGLKLITMFPVGDTFVQTLLKPEDYGDTQPITSRYNAHLDGVDGKTFTGIRRKVQ